MKIIKTFETFISQTELVDFDSFSKKIRDTLKNEYCQNNNVHLIRIKYDQNINEELVKLLQD